MGVEGAAVSPKNGSMSVGDGDCEEGVCGDGMLVYVSYGSHAEGPSSVKEKEDGAVVVGVVGAVVVGVLGVVGVAGVVGAVDVVESSNDMLERSSS